MVEEGEGLGFEEGVVGDGEEDEGRVHEEGVGAVVDGVGEEGVVGRGLGHALGRKGFHVRLVLALVLGQDGVRSSNAGVVNQFGIRNHGNCCEAGIKSFFVFIIFFYSIGIE